MRAFRDFFQSSLINDFLFRSVPDRYVESLLNEGTLTQSNVDEITKGHHNYLQLELNNLDSYKPEQSYFQRQWQGMTKAKDQITIWNTGLDPSLLGFIGNSSVAYPEDFVSVSRVLSVP